MSIIIGIAALGVAGVASQVTAPRVTSREALAHRDIRTAAPQFVGAHHIDDRMKKAGDCNVYQGGATGIAAGAIGGCSYDEALAAAKAQCAEYGGEIGAACDASIKVVVVGKKVVDAVKKLKFW